MIPCLLEIFVGQIVLFTCACTKNRRKINTVSNFMYITGKKERGDLSYYVPAEQDDTYLHKNRLWITSGIFIIIIIIVD